MLQEMRHSAHLAASSGRIRNPDRRHAETRSLVPVGNGDELPTYRQSFRGPSTRGLSSEFAAFHPVQNASRAILSIFSPSSLSAWSVTWW